MVFTLKMAKLNMNLNNFNMKIFKDSNDWNEKAIVGFIAFLIMCMIMMALVINKFVYDSFVWIVLGCFGISGIEKFSKYTEKCEKNCDKK